MTPTNIAHGIKWKTLAFVLFVAFCSIGSAQNLLHNGSFEAGAAGWTRTGQLGITSEGADMPTASAVVSSNNAYVHGGHSFYNVGIVRSASFMCWAGQTNTLTWSDRASSSLNVHAAIMPLWQVNVDPGVDDTNGTVAAYSSTATTAWTRHTNQYVVKTNGLHIVKFYQAGSPMWIDAVMVETGSVAHAFQPMSPIEFNVDTADPENVLFVGDSKVARFTYWNDPVISATTNMTTVYTFPNLWNTNLAWGTISTNSMVTGATVINLNLPATWGTIRTLSYVTNLPHTWNETIITAFPFAAQTGVDLNGLMGADMNWGTNSLADARRLGVARARMLSQTREFRWEQLYTNLTTVKTFGTAWYTDFIVSNAMNYSSIPFFVVLTPEDNIWRSNTAETNANWTVMRDSFIYYGSNVIYRYRPGNPSGLVITNYEIINESQQGRATVDLNNPVYYSDLYTNLLAVAKAISSDINFLCCGGVSSAGQGTNQWAYISPWAKSNTWGHTFHFYPGNSGAQDPNDNDDIAQYTTANYYDWQREYLTNKFSWNTENATRDTGAYHSELAAFAYPFWGSFADMKDASGAAIPNYWSGNQLWNQELDERGHINATMRVTYNFLRTVGSGFTHFNFQYITAINDNVFSGNTPTIYELNYTLKPWAAALFVANHLVKKPGLGRIYNTNENNIEAWGFTNSIGCVAPAFAPNKGNYRITTTNSNIAQFDCMGNLIKASGTNFDISRLVTYLVSSNLTYAQFSATIGSASAATNADTIAPGLTVDVSPIGATTAWGTRGTNIFKFTAIDNAVSNYGVSNSPPNVPLGNIMVTNVYYRYTFDRGATWSAWSQTNVFAYSFPVATNCALGVQAKDKIGNTTPTVYGPNFGDLTVPEAIPDPSTNGLTINATVLNVGTLILR